MQRRTPHWFATLRRWRRGISVASLPALAWWSLSAAACFAMPMDRADAVKEMTASHHAESTPMAHDSNGMHDHAGMPDCPHCTTPPQKSDTSTPLCVAQATSSPSGSHANPNFDGVKLLAQARLTLSSSAAPPPLISRLPAYTAPPAERTPLNVRHCVFLI
jgi:hypothetical protein